VVRDNIWSQTGLSEVVSLHRTPIATGVDWIMDRVVGKDMKGVMYGLDAYMH